MAADLIMAGVIILAAIVVLLLISVLLCSVLNVTGYVSTGSRKLKPDGATKGKALVVYDTGLSGSAKKMATDIAGDMQSRGYEVVLAGVRSADAADVSDCDVIVAGGPVYSSTVSNSVKAYLKALAPGKSAKVGAFARGWAGNVFENPFPGAVPLKATLVEAKMQTAEKKRTGFVDRLLH